MEDDEFKGDYRWHDEEPTPKRLSPIGQEKITIEQTTTEGSNQTLQIKRQVPQIIIEDQKTEDMSNEKINYYPDTKFPEVKPSNIKFSDTKSSNTKSSSTKFSDDKSKEQKLDGKSVSQLYPIFSAESDHIKLMTGKTPDNSQKPEKLEKEEPAITKSDIKSIIQLLQKIQSGTQELSGLKEFIYDEKGREDIEKGNILIKKYRNYYDVVNTIKTAGPVNPNDFDSPVYNKERIFEDLERYADIINVINDGTDTLFVVVSHGSRTNFSQEAIIFPGEVKTYYWVYELRLRSPTKGLQYRVTEYDIMDVSESPLIPIERAVLHDESLPDTDTNWLPADIVPLRTPTTFRLQVAVSIAGVLSTVIARTENEQIVFFNATSGPNLLADGLYEFEMLVHEGDSINFRYSATGGTIRVLRVQEIDSATA